MPDAQGLRHGRRQCQSRFLGATALGQGRPRYPLDVGFPPQITRGATALGRFQSALLGVVTPYQVAVERSLGDGRDPVEGSIPERSLKAPSVFDGRKCRVHVAQNTVRQSLAEHQAAPRDRKALAEKAERPRHFLEPALHIRLPRQRPGDGFAGGGQALQVAQALGDSSAAPQRLDRFRVARESAQGQTPTLEELRDAGAALPFSERQCVVEMGQGFFAGRGHARLVGRGHEVLGRPLRVDRGPGLVVVMRESGGAGCASSSASSSRRLNVRPTTAAVVSTRRVASPRRSSRRPITRRTPSGTSRLSMRRSARQWPSGPPGLALLPAVADPAATQAARPRSERSVQPGDGADEPGSIEARGKSRV
jgi:hypothetical protein